ncbi:hypothetical protein DFP72DRAFT_876179 [Ephemerocybe angulata]|uniref:Uncharacterized protein n=1 Tax=Ephemerocybe angulata TaxID=980116 RepID=A0A8H6IE23_9AGAR|nr:hypothetical protein DFP72DRAFT_876179 [Tulosesus angulatus]
MTACRMQLCPNRQSNPDTRPLPQGWYQHYDPSYYVQTSVHPPKHSYTHPSDANPGFSEKKSRQAPIYNYASPTSDAAAKPLSAAQRLYASANSGSGNSGYSTPEIVIPAQSQPPAHSQAQRPNASRTQSQGSIFTTATQPSNYYNSHRSTTLPSPPGAYSAPVGFSSTERNEVRHIVTKAQPPSVLFSAQMQPPRQHYLPYRRHSKGRLLPALPIVQPSPANFNTTATSPPPFAKTPAFASGTNTTNRFMDQAKRGSLALGKQVGVATAKFIASGLGSMVSGIDFSSLTNALLGTSIDASGLQAVLQAQPGADYAAAIAALQQQQLQQPSPTVDYQALINQVQQLQAMALTQQQQINALQSANQGQQTAAVNGFNGTSPPFTAAVSQTTLSPPPLPPNPVHTPSPSPVHSPTQQHHVNNPQQAHQGHNLNGYQGTNAQQNHSGGATAPQSYQPPPPFQEAYSIPPDYNQVLQSQQLQLQMQAQQMAIQQQQQQAAMAQAIQQQQQPNQAAVNAIAGPPDIMASYMVNAVNNNNQAQQNQQQFQQQLQEQQLAIQQQQQAAIAQAVQQQQLVIQQQQQLALQQQQQAATQQQNFTQAAINAIAPPPAEQGPSFTDLMASYLTNAVTNSSQAAPTDTSSSGFDYNQILSSLGASTQSLDMSSLTSGADFSSTDLSGALF